jgi:hypothetical protein
MRVGGIASLAPKSTSFFHAGLSEIWAGPGRKSGRRLGRVAVTQGGPLVSLAGVSGC